MKKVLSFSTLQITMLCLCAFMISFTVSAQEITREFHSHVQDAETGEPLPYVNISVAEGLGTLTNMDGDFTIVANAESQLEITYVGFEKLTFKAGKLPKTIKLKPQTRTLDEVVVIPVEAIMKNVKNKLYKDYSKRKTKQSNYFYRQLTTTKNKELLEAFIEANCATNLRELTMLGGRHGRVVGTAFARPLIADMNLHTPLELGPMINDSHYWRGMINLFSHFRDEKETLDKYYNAELDIFKDKDGKKTYCINFSRKDTTSRKVILTGKVYVDADTYALKSFDGKVEGMIMEVTKDFVRLQSPIELNLHIDYTHNRKFTEVQNLAYTITCNDINNTALLFNIGEKSLKSIKKKSKGQRMEGNILAKIDDAQFQDFMTQYADVVQRTEEENEAIESEAAENLLTTHYNIKSHTTPMKWNLTLPDNRLGNLTNRLAKMGQVIPQEKVYVHMDNTSYFLGDSIWFSAYLRRTSDDQISNISGVMYVELYNDDGYLMQRKTIETKNGRGHGAFYINPDWYTGYYELRAYTRWQLNWGVFEHKHSYHSKYWFIAPNMQQKYYRDYEKLYSRVFPVYDQPKTPGQYNENMTLREFTRYFKNDPDKPTLQLSLYPEGGELILGQPCRIAFEASYSDGEFCSGELSIDNGKNAEPTITHTTNRGRGVFVYTPTKNSEREVVFTAANGDKAKAKLPKAEQDGVALTVVRKDNDWTITAHASGDIKADSLGLTIMHEGRVSRFLDLSETNTLTIDNDDLECGVNQATVFNSEGQVIADRLFFVTRPNLSASSLTIEGIKDEYKPYEKVDLNVSIDTAVVKSVVNRRDKTLGTISLSVRDRETSNDLFDNASMQAEMLLSSELRGFIPSPGWYFEQDDEEHRNALDLLMMTQGWRRFNWREMAVRGAWDITQPDERTPIIVGEIYSYNPDFFYHPKDRKDMYLDVAEQDISSDVEDLLQNEMPGEGSRGLKFNGVIESPESESLTIGSNNESGWERAKEIERCKTSHIAPSVKVHAELSVIGTTDNLNVETLTDQGKFRITMPKFYSPSVFFLAASDTAKWKLDKKYKWIQNMPDYDQRRKFRAKPAEFSVRIDEPYPRFVKPYDFYQSHVSYSDSKLGRAKALDDGSIRLAEVNVNAKRKTYRHLNDTIPAFMVDGYEALNFAMDAGMLSSDPHDIVRAYVSDYGLENPFVFREGGKDDRIREIRGADGVRRAIKGKTLDQDEASLRKNLVNDLNDNGNTAYGYEKYEDLSMIEKYVIYTDYQPRKEGSLRYYGSNLPHTYIAVVPYVDDSKRLMYRDRRYILPGIAYPDEFYHPNYSGNRLPENPDYRRTLYWNPDLPLDANGKAKVSFFNNSKSTQITVSAEGVANNGQTLSSK